MSNFLILHPTGLLYKMLHIIIIFNPKAMKFADLCQDSMAVILFCHVYDFGFVYENINIFLSNDHIWNYQNLNSPIS